MIEEQAREALSLARRLQSRSGMHPFRARCEAARVYGVTVGDVNRAYYASKKKSQRIVVAAVQSIKSVQLDLDFMQGNKE